MPFRLYRSAAPVLAGLLVAMLAASSARAVIVAHYKFDEAPGSTTAVDSVGGINGSVAGPGPAFVPGGGVSGNAISIPGSGFVTMGNNFGFTSGSFSVAAWVQISNGNTTGMLAAGKHRSTVNAGYFLALNNVGDSLGAAGANKAHFFQSGPTSGASTTTINDGQWHQMIGIYDTATNLASIAVDGSIQSSAARNTIGGIGDPFMVGGFANSGGALTNTYNGLIDDVQLYNHALTADDVEFLFANPGSPLPEPATLTALAAALLTLACRRRRC